jgi:hypothetical protein
MSHLSPNYSKAAFSKKELLELYDNVDMQTFEAWIVEIKQQIGWRKGKQVFPPRMVRIIIDHIGEPISMKVLK